MGEKNSFKRLEKLEEVSRSFPGISSSYAIQAGREIRIMVKPEEVSEDQMTLLARDIAKKIAQSMMAWLTSTCSPSPTVSIS